MDTKAPDITKASETDLTIMSEEEDMTESSVATQIVESIALREPLRSNTKSLYRTNLQFLNCSFDIVTPEGKDILQDVVREQIQKNGANVAILFAARHPSCPSCREHARQLSEFAATDRRLTLFGATRFGPDTEGEAILDFYQNYFRHPMYQDAKWNIYWQMGRRNTHMLIYMFRLKRAIPRYEKNGIQFGPTMPVKGHQGGVLIFDKKGELRFAYDEKPFVEFDMDALALAVRQTRKLYRRDSM